MFQVCLMDIYIYKFCVSLVIIVIIVVTAASGGLLNSTWRQMLWRPELWPQKHSLAFSAGHWLRVHIHSFNHQTQCECASTQRASTYTDKFMCGKKCIYITTYYILLLCTLGLISRQSGIERSTHAAATAVVAH